MHKCKFCLVYAKAVFQLLGTPSSAQGEQPAAFAQPEQSVICFVPALLRGQVSPRAVRVWLCAAFDVKFHRAATFCPEFSGQPHHGMGCARKTSAGVTTSAQGMDGCSKTLTLRICHLCFLLQICSRMVERKTQSGAFGEAAQDRCDFKTA